MKERLEEFPEWDRDAINGKKPAMEPTTDILVREQDYPQFLNAAFNEVLVVLAHSHMDELWKVRNEPVQRGSLIDLTCAIPS